MVFWNGISTGKSQKSELSQVKLLHPIVFQHLNWKSLEVRSKLALASEFHGALELLLYDHRGQGQARPSYRNLWCFGTSLERSQRSGPSSCNVWCSGTSTGRSHRLGAKSRQRSAFHDVLESLLEDLRGQAKSEHAYAFHSGLEILLEDLRGQGQIRLSFCNLCCSDTSIRIYRISGPCQDVSWCSSTSTGRFQRSKPSQGKFLHFMVFWYLYL